MDPISTELAKESISATVEAAKGFLTKLLGPATEEIGLVLQDKVKLYRFNNQLRILAKAEAMLQKAGLTPKAIPFRTLFPIIEASAFEDDESLCIKWAALLANSAASVNSSAAHPSFPRILSEIAPAEARFLDYLYSKGEEIDWKQFRTELAHLLQVTEEEINKHYGNLFRLGLVLITHPKGRPDNMVKIGPFGNMFLVACIPPEPSDT